MPSEVKRLRQLKEENAKLKPIVADLSLDRAILWEMYDRPRPGRIDFVLTTVVRLNPASREWAAVAARP